MPGSPQSDDQDVSERICHPADSGSVYSDFTSNPHDRADTRTSLPSNLEERELEAALQLLVERAQYITGATGTALALPQGNEMVCRASAGACAPTVGARLQVRSGLTGESIARRQLLRCDNAESDPRVNLETCRALGIASIVVLPLLRRNGEVRGLFELFSDHPYAFEERDLVALERMAALTMTALDLAEQQHDSVAPAATPAKEAKPPGQATSPATSTTFSPGETPAPQLSRTETDAGVHDVPRAAEPMSVSTPAKSAQMPELPSAGPIAAAQISPPEIAPPVESAGSISPPVVSPSVMPAPVMPAPIMTGPVISAPVVETSPPEPAPVPEAMRRIQKCASCGFPVSEGRTLCLDCESLDRMKIESEKRLREKAAREVRQIEANASKGESAEARTAEEQNDTSTNEGKEDHSAESSAAVTRDEILPPFLTNPQLVEESWMARHVNLLAFLVLVAAVLVAAVVFFR